MLSLVEFAVKYLDKLGASYSEARGQLTSGSGFVLKNGIPAISSFEKINGIGLRFVVNNALGFASTNNLNRENIKSIAKKAVKTTKKASQISDHVKFSDEKFYSDKYSVKQKIKLDNVDPSEKLKILFDADKRISKLIKMPGRYISLSDWVTTEYLVNSEGANLTATVPRVNLFYFLTVQKDNKTMQRYWQYGNCGGFEFVKKWNIPQLLTNEVRALKTNLEKGIKSPKGNMNVIVGPQVTGIMVHESVGHPYEADRILGREAAQAGESFVTLDMLGRKISKPFVNVVDNPIIKNSNGFYLYDNEGVKARKKFLIKNGKINELLHNRETAAHIGVKSNGSSRAVDYDKESIVRMSNTFLLPGNYKENELIKEIKNGIYIKNFMEWNIDDKRLNQKYTGCEAYLVKKGEIAAPIRSPTIETTTPDLWKSVRGIADNIELHAGTCGKGEPMQGIPVTFGGPSVWLRIKIS